MSLIEAQIYCVTWMSSDDVIPLPTSALSEIMHSGKKSCERSVRVYTPKPANTSCSTDTYLHTWELQRAAGSVPLVSWRTRTWRSFCRKRTWCRLWGTRLLEPPAPPRGPLDTSLRRKTVLVGVFLSFFVNIFPFHDISATFSDADRYSYLGRGSGAPPAGPSSPGHCSEPSAPTCDTHL